MGNDKCLMSRQKAGLKKAFECAKSADEMQKAFKEMEASRRFEESELGLECWEIADRLVQERGIANEEVIRFGKRALSIFISNHNNNIPCFGKTCSSFNINNDDNSLIHNNHGSSLVIPCVLNLLGSACLELERYNECLSYLNWANRNLSKLERDEEDDGSCCCSNKCVLLILRDTQRVLSKVKATMGRIEETVIHLRKIVEIVEKTEVEGCLEIGKANKDVYRAYFEAVELKEAFPFCLKALEIHAKHLGENSLEVARMTRHLAVIYEALGEYEKSLEKNKLSQSILKKMAPDSTDLLAAEIESSSVLIHLGRNKEAIVVLKDVVSHAETGGSTQASAFVYMAKALYNLGKHAEAKKRMKTAQRILEKKEINYIFVASGFEVMSLLYEKMNDSETALALTRRVLAIPELPLNLLSQNSSRFFKLISQYGKEKEGILYIEDVVEKLKEKFGSQHFEVGYAYGNLGVAYLKLGQLELAVKFMKNAKELMDATIGPNHVDSLRTNQILATTYARLGRFYSAIEIQEKVVEGLKGLRLSEAELLDKAVIYLNRMKETVADPESAMLSRMMEKFSTTISECVLSDDGKV